MADSVQRRGRDTFVGSSNPDKPQNQNEILRLSSGSQKVYVYLPLPGVRKRIIEQATLTCPVANSWSSQTLTVTPVDEEWTPRKTTWNDQPSLRTGQAISSPQSAKSVGQRIEIDVTDHVQRVADGAKHYGWEIKTGSGAANRLYAFEYPDMGSWVLSIDFTEAPEPPTDLAPNGSVVGVEPVLTFEFSDLGGESTELAAVKVQVNSSASSSGAWTSAETDAVTPEFDLAASSWPTTPVDGMTYYWRAMVADGAGYWSDWSDWASFIYDPKPVLTIDNPSTGIAWDPTPTIAAHIDSGVIKAWRIRIANGDDKTAVIYDSGKQKGNGSDELAHTIPFWNRDRGLATRILRDDNDYWLNVRIWDRNDRQPTPGDPAWTQEWVQFHLDDDLTPPPPSNLVANQIGDTPRVRLTWVRDTGFPEGWVIRRNDEVIARLDPDEVEVDDNVYTWVDNTAAPWSQHEYKVKVIDGGKQSAGSPLATISTKATGLWLLSDDAEVCIEGPEVGDFKTVDKRARYSPVNTPYDVDIVYAFMGVAGTYTGSISDRGERYADDSRAVLLDMKGRPHRAVQLSYGTVSVPVELSDVSVLPAPDFLPNNRRHNVTLTVQQVGDFEVR